MSSTPTCWAGEFLALDDQNCHDDLGCHFPLVAEAGGQLDLTAYHKPFC
jgi:hypothetical protein